MNKQLQLRAMLSLCIALMGFSLFAEDIIFDPSKLTPDADGYYRGGVWKDLDGNGEDELYNGCWDEYSESFHHEAGTYNDFTYNDAMVMPTCYPKDCYEDGDFDNPVTSKATVTHALGYIQLNKSDSIGYSAEQYGYILSPPIENLTELSLELSTDKSYSESSPILFWVEYLTSNGTILGDAYIEESSTTKTGDLHTYNSSNTDFAEMIEASGEGAIQIRICTKPYQRDPVTGTVTYHSQYLKVHYVNIVADKSTSSMEYFTGDENKIIVTDNTITTRNSTKIQVFNILGQPVGNGVSVAVDKGIYIVRTSNGNAQRVLVE